MKLGIDYFRETWNRKAEEIIYSKFHGNDIKRLCQALLDFSKIPLSEESHKILGVLKEFDKWAEMVSTTRTNLSDFEAACIACKDTHSLFTCCQTAILIKGLENVGGFGQSPLIHAMLMHLGPFIHNHRLIGAVSEEEIETLHSNSLQKLYDIKRPKIFVC